MATIDSAPLSRQNSKATRSIFAAIRVIRLILGVILLFCAVKYSPVFIFLFDSPGVMPALVVGLILSVPISFLLSEKAYKTALAQGHFQKGVLFGVAPLLLVGVYAGILTGIEELTPAQRSHRDGLIVLPNGEELFIRTPDMCKIENFRVKYEISGKWQLSDDGAHFVCDDSTIGSEKLLIQEALSIPYNESLIRGNPMLDEKNGDFEVYRYSNNGSDQFEVTRFTGYDGIRVSVRQNLSFKSGPYRFVSRRLDHRFELTYGVAQEVEGRTGLVKIDRSITEYARSISHRKK